jgi:hypothetical protein
MRQVPPEFWQLTAAGNTGSGFAQYLRKLEILVITQSNDEVAPDVALFFALFTGRWYFSSGTYCPARRRALSSRPENG